PSDLEPGIANHVGQRHQRDSCTKEIRTLRDRGRDEQPSVRSAQDPEPIDRRNALLHELLGACVEVVEDVLLLRQRSRLVPLLTDPPAPAKDGGPPDRAPRDARERAYAERGGLVDVEAAVAVEHGGILTVLLESLLRDDEHRQTGAVPRGGIEASHF